MPREGRDGIFLAFKTPTPRQHTPWGGEAKGEPPRSSTDP